MKTMNEKEKRIEAKRRLHPGMSRSEAEMHINIEDRRKRTEEAMLQHCSHVAAYYWFKYKRSNKAVETEGFYQISQDYGLAAWHALHAAKFFRH